MTAGETLTAKAMLRQLALARMDLSTSWDEWGVCADWFNENGMWWLAVPTRWCFKHKKTPGKAALYKNRRFWWPTKAGYDYTVGYGPEAVRDERRRWSYRWTNVARIPETHILPRSVYVCMPKASHVNSLRAGYGSFTLALEALGQALLEVRKTAID